MQGLAEVPPATTGKQVKKIKWPLESIIKLSLRWRHTPELIPVFTIGAVHKVCHVPRGKGSEKEWQFVTGGGVKIMCRHTFNFFTIHNFMFYFIFHNAKYKFVLQQSPSELYEIKLVRGFQCYLKTLIKYGLLLLFKIVRSNDYSYLKQSPFSFILAC